MKKYVSANEHYEISKFLYYESDLLDQEKYEDWLDILTEDFVYVVPVKEVRGTDRYDYYSDQNYYFKDDKRGLEDRIKRLLHREGWASKMHTQTRRFISNITASKEDSYIMVEYNIMLARTEPDVVDNALITGRRVDQIVKDADGYQLHSRNLYLDQTSLVIYNLYFPI